MSDPKGTRDRPEAEKETPAAPERESIWSVSARWFPVYMTLFVIQGIGIMSLICWNEITNRTDDGVVETILAIYGESAPMLATAVAVSVMSTETGRQIMVLATYLERWLKEKEEKRRERLRARARAEGHAEGHAEGRADERRAWRDWNSRRIDAESEGRAFDEPPPGENRNGQAQP